MCAARVPARTVGRMNVDGVDGVLRGRLVAAWRRARAAGRDGHAGALGHVLDEVGVPDRFLLGFAEGAGGVTAAVCAGVLDRGANVAVVVPGIGTRTGNLARMVAEADRLRLLADEQNRAAGCGVPTAAVAWLGYRTPTVSGSLRRDRSAASYRSARSAAAALAGFCRRWGRFGRLTLVGHSYGSVVAGAALGAGVPAVAAVVAAGSPGLGCADVGVFAGRGVEVFALEAFGDAVAGLGWFGADPGGLAGVRKLATGRSVRGRAGRGHTSYLAEGTTSLWNIAAVVGGDVSAVVPVERRVPMGWASGPVKAGIQVLAETYHRRDAVWV